jgi:hypothetical protein
MDQKQVKIIGLSIKENFGALKATELSFDEDMRLTVIKGEVGAGKSTLNKAMRLTTQGSAVLTDKSLYGDNIHLETQISDGDKKIFVGCKSGKDDSLGYFIYMVDENGKKINDVVVDGVKLTPANYLKSMQTALTWRLDELTSENPITQRNILLELYSQELETKGVIFDKNHTNYVGGIIDKIEKAKNQRNYADMKRKEVGGIADDMQKKGIDFSERMSFQDSSEIESSISRLEAEITLAKTNVESTRESELNKLKLAGSDAGTKLRNKNEEIRELNKPLEQFNNELKDRNSKTESWSSDLLSLLKKMLNDDSLANQYLAKIRSEMPKIEFKTLFKELEFNEKGSCISKKDDFEDISIKELISNYQEAVLNYINKTKEEPGTVDTSKQEKALQTLKTRLSDIKSNNDTAKAVNSFFDWKDANEEVNSFNKDYFLKLTEINTGVDGLFICPEFIENEKGEKIAKGNDIYLMYDGRYDKKYFSNENKDLRKLSSYSDTQKPMICLLIQKYLLSKKAKALPYLWIDQVPIDKKTKELLDRMSEELGLWLFVNWTGDFEKENLKDGEILIENGEIFFNH